MTVLISNGKDFYDITDIIPKLLNVWGQGTEQEAIEALMLDSGCFVCVKGGSFTIAAEKLIHYKFENKGLI